MTQQIQFINQFKRQYAGALDPDIIFATKAEMQDYLINPLRYAGMIVTCNELEGKIFVLNNAKTVWTDVVGGYNYYNMWYGVKMLVGQTSPTLTRIGNTDLHKVAGGLPVNTKMRRCLVKNGVVNYYLHPTNSALRDTGSAAILNGTDGDVMVEIPAFYIRFYTEVSGSNLYNCVAVSEYPLIGFKLVEKHYISAYEASLNRSTLVAYSVANNTATYRGGNNNAAYDAGVNTLLGSPVTTLTRANERAYAAAKGTGWCEEPFEYYGYWRWLFVIEYATTNSQLAVNATLTAEGYRQGGLGNGIIDAVSAEWNTFNTYNPFCPCGTSNSLGNQTGEVSLVKTDFGGAGVNRTFKCNSYRGIENPFGHLYKRLEGININKTGGKAYAYGKKGVSGFADGTATGYTLLGELPVADGYILNQMFGEDGIMLPLTVGGGASSSAGWCDYYYYPTADGWTAPLSSAAAPAGGNAGIAYVLATNSAANATAYLGFRLCFKP